jgi:hypothetical protein
MIGENIVHYKNQQCGFLMTWQKTALFARATLTYLEENIIVGTVEGILNIYIMLTYYSLVCYQCSTHYEYVAGYGD